LASLLLQQPLFELLLRCLSVINDGELPSDHDIMIGPTLKLWLWLLS
jgi:hypothetical protein